MSRKSVDLKQKSEDQSKHLQSFTYHTKYNSLTCVCGEKLESGHKCGNVIRVKVVECKENECDICAKMEIESMYYDQWTEDRDGYSVCSYCWMKSEVETLPKNCECYGYIDEQGNILCNRCNKVLNDVTEYCGC